MSHWSKGSTWNIKPGSPANRGHSRKLSQKTRPVTQTSWAAVQFPPALVDTGCDSSVGFCLLHFLLVRHGCWPRLPVQTVLDPTRLESQLRDAQQTIASLQRQL